MTNQNTATTNQVQHNREELEALLEIVPDCTVGNLKKLYEELTGEITRSNNKPSLIKRVSAQIQRLLEDDEIPDAVDTDITSEEDLDDVPVEDASEEEATYDEDNTCLGENADAISADSEKPAESEETEMTTTDDAENSETDGSCNDEDNDPQDMHNDSRGTDQTDDDIKSTKRSSKPKKQRERDPRLPPAGTILSREYKGVRHEVTVLEEGFTYNGEHFRSLSKIAKHIARGTSWNGFIFFKNSLLRTSPGE